MKSRKLYFDTIKLFAIFVVFTTHFVATFNEDYFRFWTDLPTAFFLKGVSGKFGVAVFSVILGYFAFRSSEKNIAKYTIKRYVYFVLCGLFINAVYALYAVAWHDDPVTLYRLIRTSVLLGSSIYPTFWCIRPFMAGSFVSRLNRLVHDRMKKDSLTVALVIAEAAVFIYLKQIWIAICIMGNAVPVLEDNETVRKIISSRAVRIIIYLAAFCAIKRSGSDITYLIDGFSSAFVLLALSRSTQITRILNNRALASAGRNTMAIYLIHNLLYETIGGYIVSDSAFVPTFLAAFVISWVVIVLLSYPVTSLLNGANRLCGGIIDKVFSLTDTTDKKGAI